MKKKDLEKIFGAGRVSDIDGELGVSCIYTLGVQQTTELNKFCIKHGLDYNVKPASASVFIKFYPLGQTSQKF